MRMTYMAVEAVTAGLVLTGYVSLSIYIYIYMYVYIYVNM